MNDEVVNPVFLHLKGFATTFNRHLNGSDMIVLLSPSKTMNFSGSALPTTLSLPQFAKEADAVMRDLQSFFASDIVQREHLSVRLAYSTYESYQRFFAADQLAKAALFAYSGTVFNKLNPAAFTVEQCAFADDHLRIFSALYGLLRPFDVIRPYRLDMNSGLTADLYAFWCERVTAVLMDTLSADDGVLINLASAEYFRIVDESKIVGSFKVITPVFKQEKQGKLVINSLYAKEARGLMARFIIEHQLTDHEHLKAFMEQGYVFSTDLSSQHEWGFVR
jgi:cytoplasmic iron level regulating protein YaaA (DUF328/UPF0246 family)